MTVAVTVYIVETVYLGVRDRMRRRYKFKHYFKNYIELEIVVTTAGDV